MALSSVPGESDGSGTVTFQVRFSKETEGYSYRTLRDETLNIRQDGTRVTPEEKRLRPGSNLAWQVTTTPVSWADMSVTG